MTLQADSNKTAGDGPVTPRSPQSKAKTIMIVEDDESLRLLLRRTMQRRGFAILDAENGLAAQQIFEKHRDQIDAIVSDVRMPVVDGVGFLNYVRARSKVPFVIMTGFTSKFGESKAVEMGADSYIQKPFEPELLAQTVRSLLH